MSKKSKAMTLVIALLLIVVSIYLYNYFQSQQIQEIDLEQIALPKGANGQIVTHKGYTLCYSEEDEQPYWVAYVLTPEETVNSVVKRDDNFREDPFIKTGSATLADYKGSGYDRGHLIPFADLSWSEESASDSFFLSNMSPQNASLNRGRWQELESVVRTFSLEGPICVVTGPVLTDGPYKKIGKNQVSVPNFYYKVILDFYGDSYKAIGFILPNEKCQENLEFYATSVDEVESLTGLDFFPLLEDSLEEYLEQQVNIEDWDFSAYSKKKAQEYGY